MPVVAFIVFVELINQNCVNFFCREIGRGERERNFVVFWWCLFNLKWWTTWDKIIHVRSSSVITKKPQQIYFIYAYIMTVTQKVHFLVSGYGEGNGNLYF